VSRATKRPADRRHSGAVDGSAAARTPLVSVVIPAYNSAAVVGGAIDSVLRQSYRRLVVIVVDDGATDATSSVVREYILQDERVRLLTQANAGAPAARNRGVEAARGELVAFLDADDEWLPSKLERQVRELKRDSHVAAVGCLMEYVSTAGRVLGVSGEQAHARQHDIAAARFMPFGASSLVTWTHLVRELGGFDEQLAELVPGLVDDLDLVSRLAGRGSVVTVPEVLGRYRIHSGSASARHYFSQRQGIRYLAARVEARREGRDLSWEQFIGAYPPTLRERRADLVAYCYRTAGLHVANKKTVSGIGYLTAAGILGPRYTIPRLLRQRFRKPQQ
jgi:glycosyltransferase involved in cell wall biosynthesis